MINQTGNTDQIKQLNTGLVYRIIAQHGPISRIALSKQSQLAPASITKITRELMDAHLIQEREFPVLGLRGRPAVGLVIESEGWQFLAIRIEQQHAIISLKEINAKTLTEKSYPFDVKGNQQFSDRLSELIGLFFEENASHLERVTAISILLDGLLDSYSGVIHRLPDYHVHQLDIGELLTEKTGLPVYLHPTVNALAIGDHLKYSESRPQKNIIYLQIQDVVNIAVLNHGYSLDSITHQPILFAHTQTDSERPQSCYCGGKGCLETKIAIPAIIQQARELLADYPASILHKVSIDINTISRGAIENDPLCILLLDITAKRLAYPLAMMINLFGTELILVNSPLTDEQNYWLTRLQYFISLYGNPLYSNKLTLDKSIISIKESETALIQNALYDGSLLLQLLQG
ncbi:ROK family protein [Providencia sp. PROV202]|uniref:ROK family protein n=1 Tax=Providencia sp. PROV202 TaxID=2949902 RepID=UPI0023494751|nr:ROK family protein [Providencia sp. PROV202]